MSLLRKGNRVMQTTNFQTDNSRTISKDMGPAVDPNLYVRIDVVGDSDTKQATISAMETRSRAWAFKATFAPPIHPALVSDCNAVAADYIQEMLDRRVVDGLVFFSFALPSKRSELGSHGAVFVTGVLKASRLGCRLGDACWQILPACRC